MNHYAPPTDDDGIPATDDRQPFVPASLGRRFMGALVDGLFALILWAAIATALSLARGGKLPAIEEIGSTGASGDVLLASAVASAFAMVINGALVATRGQTIGKILLLTRIVDEDGKRAGLMNGVVTRMVPFTAVALLPRICTVGGMSPGNVQGVAVLTGLFALLDAGLILGPYRQCLHDRVAGTYVANVGSERPRRADPPRRKKKRKRVRLSSAGS